MQSRDLSYRHAVLDALSYLRGQWTAAVLAELALSEIQYKDLLTTINQAEVRAGWARRDHPLSDHVLSDTLGRMHDDGLVARRAEEGSFARAWYRLTPKGRSLLAAVRPLAEWARQHPRDRTSRPDSH